MKLSAILTSLAAAAAAAAATTVSPFPAGTDNNTVDDSPSYTEPIEMIFPAPRPGDNVVPDPAGVCDYSTSGHHAYFYQNSRIEMRLPDPRAWTTEVLVSFEQNPRSLDQFVTFIDSATLAKLSSGLNCVAKSNRNVTLPSGTVATFLFKIDGRAGAGNGNGNGNGNGTDSTKIVERRQCADVLIMEKYKKGIPSCTIDPPASSRPKQPSVQFYLPIIVPLSVCAFIFFAVIVCRFLFLGVPTLITQKSRNRSAARAGRGDDDVEIAGVTTTNSVNKPT